MRKPSGGERAWFLEEESEPRNKRILIDLCSKSIRGYKGVCPFGRRAKREKGRQRAVSGVRGTSEGGKRSCSPSEVSMGNTRADESVCLTVSLSRK